MDDENHARLLAACASWERMYGELFVKAQRLSDEVGVLREALTALLDAVNNCVFSASSSDEMDAARAAAAAGLGTGANLGDSGMSESGGVSDGPQ